MTNLLTKNNLYLLTIVALIIVLLLQRSCNGKNEADLLQRIANYKDTATHYSLKNGEVVATNNALILQSDAQVRALLSSQDTVKQLLSKFKEVKTVVVVRQVTSIVHDTIKFTTRIPCDFAPIRFKQDSNKVFHLSGYIMPTKLIIDTFTIPNKQTIVVGDKRKGLFGRETTVDVANSNPLVSINGIKGYVVAEKKWYDNKWLALGAGAILGGAGVYKLHQIAK